MYTHNITHKGVIRVIYGIAFAMLFAVLAAACIVPINRTHKASAAGPPDGTIIQIKVQYRGPKNTVDIWTRDYDISGMPGYVMMSNIAEEFTGNAGISLGLVFPETFVHGMPGADGVTMSLSAGIHLNNFGALTTDIGNTAPGTYIAYIFVTADIADDSNTQSPNGSIMSLIIDGQPCGLASFNSMFTNISGYPVPEFVMPYDVIESVINKDLTYSDFTLMNLIRYTLDAFITESLPEDAVSFYHDLNSVSARIPGAFGVYQLALFTRAGPRPLPEPPTKVGHDFVGWYLDAELTRPYEGTEITGDMQLYAKFVPKIYTVTYQCNAPGITAPDMSAAYNTTISPPVLTRVGYTFDGWYADQQLKTAYDPAALVTGDMTLYAKWTIHVYTVTFVVDGETYTTVSVPHGTSFLEALKQAGLPYYAVSSVATESGLPSDGQTVSEAMTLTLSEASVPDKLLTFFKLNWIYLTAGLGGFILLIVILTAIAKKKKA